jgi:long-subunit fatty acid transport protein
MNLVNPYGGQITLMRSLFKSALVATTFLCTSGLLERAAQATNITEFPDNGSEQLGRGGAWVARASDPLAAFYNPAGLAGQPTRLTLQSNITFSHTCFTRVQAANDTTQDPLSGGPGGTFPRVCNDIAPNIGPQIAFTYRASDRVGLGFAILGPSGAAKADWPNFVNNKDGPQAAPQRYLLLNGNVLLATPTLGIGVEVVDNFRIGASFQLGIMKAKFSTASASVNDEAEIPKSNDVNATLIAQDLFIPGFTLGALYSPSDSLDVAGWFKWSDAIKASGDIYTQANYFTTKSANGDGSGIKDGDSSLPDCNVGNGNTTCKNGNNASLRINIPMEAKLGLRYHKLKGAAQKHTRDPMKTDVYDAEVDLTWANNSAFDGVRVRFPSDNNGDGIIPVNGIPSGLVPPNADSHHAFKDVLGVRAGGDYNVIPDKLALRGGAFFETNGQDQQYQNIDFIGAARVGLAAGTTLRIHLDPEKTKAVELSVGFMHVFVMTQDNNNPNAAGANGVAGTACNPTMNSQPGLTCTDGKPKYRTNWPVNLGTITNSINAINVGASYRF